MTVVQTNTIICELDADEPDIDCLLSLWAGQQTTFPKMSACSFNEAFVAYQQTAEWDGAPWRINTDDDDAVRHLWLNTAAPSARTNVKLSPSGIGSRKDQIPRNKQSAAGAAAAAAAGSYSHTNQWGNPTYT